MQAVIEGLESRALLSADFVIDWNNVAIDVLRADRTLPGPLWPSRAFAMTHAAVFDAVNGFGGPYRQLYTNGSPPNGASRNAAIAQAAHDVLVALYPLQKAFIDDALADSLAQVPNGQSEKKGTQYGKRVADAVLRARRRDHSGDVVQYTVNPAAGHWSSDPMNPGQSALGPGWGAVTPFALNSGDQFLPPHPPALTSAEYTASYNEVKSLGEKNSVTRTADQKEIGIFWAYDRPGTGTPPALYNQVVQVIANQEGNTVEENARLFALVNIAQADAGITSWDCKYKEDLWRPVTAIRRGAEDGNPDTLAATNWIPLGAPGNGTTIPDFTPPFPAYVSGHATFGAATFEVLRQFYGTDNVNFTLRSDELPGVTRSYTSFSQASAENGRSRIYLGIHWNFDDTAGRALGAQVADWAFDNAIVPRGHGGGHGHGNNNTDVVFSREHIGTTRQFIDDTPSSELELV